MPIKRRERENSSEISTKNFRMDHIPSDHELFLQAFEKPTQIYRYLRSRNRLSPIFLHRNLTYMKDRMSRKRDSRKNFKVDSLLKMVETRNAAEEERNGAPNKFMTLMFLGFYNKSMVDEQFVEVEIIVSKISQMKRKDNFKSKQEKLGSAILKINPVDMIGEIPAVSASTELFKPAGTGWLNSSCILILKITVLPNFASVQEPIIKSDDQKPRVFETDLVIFDKHNRCTLTDGEYELTLQEFDSTASPKNFSPKKHPTWEDISESCLDDFSKGDNPLEDFTKSPTLKFRLLWTKDKYAEMVDRPLPITIRRENGNYGKPLSKEIAASAASSESSCQMNGSSATTASTTNPNTSATSKQPTNNNNNSKTRSSSNSDNVLSKDGNGSSMVVKLHDIASRIIYHFIYNNNSSQQTETVDNFNCPWCCLHCMGLYPLLKHLKLSHARFNFTYVPTPNGVRVDVSINEQFDGSYTGSPHDLVGPAGSAFARSGPVRRQVLTRILVCRPRRPKQNELSEFLEIDENELNSQRPYITGHNRLYHHTLTCLPVHPKGLDIDSEGENDPAWLQHKTKQMIDEFTDVNEGEKELMKMWNLHIMRKGYVGDIQIPLACDMFLDLHGEELLRKNLYKNFVLHLCNFFDYGLISPEVLYNTMQKLQKKLVDSGNYRDTMRESNEKQLMYWRTVGVHKQRDLKQQSPKITTTNHRNASTSKAHADQKKEEEDDSGDEDDDEEEEEEQEKNKKSKAPQQNAKSSLNTKNCKMPSASVLLKKLPIKPSSGSVSPTSTLKRRKSTILPAKEDGKTERNNSAANKRKAVHTRGESPPRRRSASAALQLNSNDAFTAKRRNSILIGPVSAASSTKKGKRLSLSGKNDK